MLNLTDYELMQLIRSGKHKALSVLYDRYGALIYSFAMKAVRMSSRKRYCASGIYASMDNGIGV